LEWIEFLIKKITLKHKHVLSINSINKKALPLEQNSDSVMLLFVIF
jgi:hypothetical protein